VRYALIDQLRKQHPVAKLCDLLNVAKSGYQGWGAGKVVPPRKLEDMHLLLAIKAAHQRGRGTYGPEKIRDELAAQGIFAGLNRIKRLRKLHGIRCMHKKKFKVTTDSKHNLPVAPNLLDRQFSQTTAPNQVWVADITYVPTDEGWLYLAALKDLHTCEIVGWANG
jgi:putative transposase